MGVPHPSFGYPAVVTGASQGIGKAMATELAARGHNLIITARRRDTLDELAARLTNRYEVTVEVRAADLVDPEQRVRLADELATRDISILCANAGGTGPAGSVGTRGTAALRTEVQLNVLGMHDLVLAVLPGMLARRTGGILVSGSVAGNCPIPFYATYAASKAFANTFTESLHGELRGTGVHVTVLAPGRVRSSSIPGFLWTSAEYSARLALDGLARNKMRVVPGLHGKAVSTAVGYPPRAMVSAAWRRILGG